MHRAPRRPLLRRLLVLTLCVATLAAPGCATFPGLLTGAFTGAVDAPMQVYRQNRNAMDSTPVFWAFNVLVVAPVGMAAGPLAGFAKGIALDVQWLLDQVTYRRAFTTYHDLSVWRPYTIHW